RRRLPIGHGRTLPRMARIEIPDGPGAPGRRVFGLRPELAGTVTDMIDAVYHRSMLPATEREVARLRVAQLNDCSACSTARAQSMIDAGVTDDDYGHLDEWRTLAGLHRAPAPGDRVRRAVHRRPPGPRRRLL